MKNNFIPIARDREYSEKQFNILFVKNTEYHKISSYLKEMSSPINSLKDTKGLLAGIRSEYDYSHKKLINMCLFKAYISLEYQ